VVQEIKEKWFGAVELGFLGLVTPGVTDLHGLPSDEVARTFVAGSSVPHDVVVRTALGKVTFECVVSEDSHDLLCAKLRTLRGHMLPGLGWQWLKVPASHPGLRTLAHSLGFAVPIDSLPYSTAWVKFDWAVERLPWWEDENERTVTIAGLSGSVDNSGGLETPAVYTCTVTGALAGGLSFGVGSETWQYDGALEVNDVLVVQVSRPREVTLNGTRCFGNVNTGSDYPWLQPGTNTITKSSGDYTLAVTWRRRFP